MDNLHAWVLAGCSLVSLPGPLFLFAWVFWFVGRLVARLGALVLGRLLACRLVLWLVGWRVGLFGVGWLVGPLLVGFVGGWLVVGLCCRLAVFGLVGLACWLVGWLAGWLGWRLIGVASLSRCGRSLRLG